MSGRVVAARLREIGHDVRALNEEAALESLSDDAVLELAAGEGRILVTNDVKDFAPLLRQWGEAGRSHPGCILIHRLDHRQFGRILEGLNVLLADRPDPSDWIDFAVFLTPRHRS